MLDYVGNDSPAFGHDAVRAFCVMVLFTGVKNDQLLSKNSMTRPRFSEIHFWQTMLIMGTTLFAN